MKTFNPFKATHSHDIPVEYTRSSNNFSKMGEFHFSSCDDAELAIELIKQGFSFTLDAEIDPPCISFIAFLETKKTKTEVARKTFSLLSLKSSIIDDFREDLYLTFHLLLLDVATWYPLPKKDKSSLEEDESLFWKMEN